jgi:predicted nucleic acid-binding protein
MFLLDTCVVSEGNKLQLDRAVDAWFAAQRQSELYFSAISVGELKYGVARLSDGRKKTELQRWLDETVVVGFAGRVLDFDQASALRWGALRAEYPSAKTVDAQIAATALTFDMTLVTRNIKDFGFRGLAVLNPWKAVGV